MAHAQLGLKQLAMFLAAFYNHRRPPSSSSLGLEPMPRQNCLVGKLIAGFPPSLTLCF